MIYIYNKHWVIRHGMVGFPGKRTIPFLLTILVMNTKIIYTGPNRFMSHLGILKRSYSLNFIIFCPYIILKKKNHRGSLTL